MRSCKRSCGTRAISGVILIALLLLLWQLSAMYVVHVADLADRHPHLRGVVREHRRRHAAQPSARDVLAADAGLRARGRARHRARPGDGLLPAALQSVRAAGRGAAPDPGAGLSAGAGAVRRHRPRDEGRADPRRLAVPDPAQHLQRRALDRSRAVRHRAHARADHVADLPRAGAFRPPARKSLPACASASRSR